MDAIVSPIRYSLFLVQHLPEGGLVFGVFACDPLFLSGHGARHRHLPDHRSRQRLHVLSGAELLLFSFSRHLSRPANGYYYAIIILHGRARFFRRKRPEEAAHAELSSLPAARGV